MATTIKTALELPQNIQTDAFNYYSNNVSPNFPSGGWVPVINQWFTTDTGKQWLTEKGYTYNPTASQSTQMSTGIKTGDLIQVPNLRGGTVQRYAFIDDNGDIWGLATKGDLATADYLKEGDSWTYVTTDPTTNKIISPSKTGQYYDPLYGQWKPMESTDLFASVGAGTTTPADQANIDYTNAQTQYTQAQIQKLQQEMNSPDPTTSNNAAMQLYGILADYAASSNSTNVNQWGNQAAAFNQAYGNAIEQNKQLMEMSTQPINLVAYLNRIRGETPPDWQIPNYQQMPDAFTGWQQQQPTNQGLPDTATILALLQQLGIGGNQQTPVNSNAATSQWNPTQQVYQTGYQSPAGTQQPPAGGILPNGQWVPSTYTGYVVTPEEMAAMNAAVTTNWGTSPVPPPKQKAADASPSQGGVDYLW